MYPIYKSKVETFYLFCPTPIITVLHFILKSVGENKYDKQKEELARFGQRPGNFSYPDEMMLAAILFPLIFATFIWAIIFSLKRKSKSKKAQENVNHN